MKIQRWRPSKGDINKIKMEQSETGKYVRYADVLAMLATTKPTKEAARRYRIWLRHWFGGDAKRYTRLGCFLLTAVRIQTGVERK